MVWTYVVITPLGCPFSRITCSTVAESPAVLGRHAIEAERSAVTTEGQTELARVRRGSQRREATGGGAARADGAHGHVALGHIRRKPPKETHADGGVRRCGRRVNLNGGGDLETIGRDGPYL